MSQLDSIFKAITTVSEELLSFGVVIAGFYALWLVMSAIIRAFQ